MSLSMKSSKLVVILAIFISVTQAWSFSKHSRNVLATHHRLPTTTATTVELLPLSNNSNEDVVHMNTFHSNHEANHQHLINSNNNISKSSLNALSLSGGNNQFNKIKSIIQKNSFLLGMACAVSFAKAYPSLGVNGGILKPELFIGKFGVTCIFLLSGVSLELAELKEAITNVKLNTIVQSGSFLAWPFLVGVPLVGMIKKISPNLLPKPLLDGLIILTCLPTTVNMAVLLTGRAGGNVASALANAVFGNLLGIFATPALLMHFFGTMIELPFLDMVLKLCNKVLLPVGTCDVCSIYL